MQNIYKCYNYTPNDNLNKTCENKKRCLLISYEQYCREFTEKNSKKSQEKSHQYYLPYNTKKCPICGGKIKHPYTGSVTMEQKNEDIKTCQLIEVCDEAGGCLGYTAICKK